MGSGSFLYIVSLRIHSLAYHHALLNGKGRERVPYSQDAWTWACLQEGPVWEASVSQMMNWETGGRSHCYNKHKSALPTCQHYNCVSLQRNHGLCTGINRDGEGMLGCYEVWVLAFHSRYGSRSPVPAHCTAYCHGK